jgi:tetratricopeptide (TPR) repeat protein
MQIPSLGRTVLLTTLLLAGSASAEETPPSPGAELEAARQATRTNPASFEAWTRRLALESMAAVIEDRSPTEADRVAAGERRMREILAEWKAARPHDGGPFLMEIYRGPDTAARPARILALAERFPGDPVVIEHASRTLDEQGKATQAADLIEGFVEAHPDVARGYEMLAARYEMNGNRAAANEVATDWMSRFPADAAALSSWLRTAGAESSAAVEGTVARALPAILEGQLAEPAWELCTALSRRKERGVAAAGETCMEEVAERGATAGLREIAARELLARAAASGSEGSAAPAIAAIRELPPGKRLAAVKALASKLRPPQDCARIVALFEALGEETGAGGELEETIAREIQWCSELFPARELYVRLFTTAPPESLRRLIVAWRTRVDGQYVQDLPVDRLLPVVERRWAERKGDAEIAEALDLLYEAGGRRAERRALLLSEGAQGRWPRDPRRLVELAEEEILAGDPEAGVELLEGALSRSPDDSRAFRAASEALMLLDRDREAQSLAERGLASESRAIRSLAHLALARLAMRDENVDAALTHYRAAIDSSESAGDVRQRADELFFVLGLAERKERIPALAEELCAGSSLREAGPSVESCVGAALARAGDPPAAARYFEAALEEGPQKPGLYNDAARALAAAGDVAGAERALRERIALDPANEAGWAELGLVLLQAKDVDGHARVVVEAERTLGAPSMMLRYQKAKLQLATGDPRGAAETLLAMQKLRPDLRHLDALLDEAYRELGAQP